MTKILQDIKLILGIQPDVIAFDKELLLFINATCAYLYLLGPSEMEALVIDESTLWPTFSNNRLGAIVKEYLLLSVRIKFDPTANATMNDSFNRRLSQLEGLIIHTSEEVV